MNERRPMVDRESRARLGRKLSSDYNLMPDPMMPPRLQELVSILLLEDAGGPQATKSEADKRSEMTRRAA